MYAQLQRILCLISSTTVLTGCLVIPRETEPGKDDRMFSETNLTLLEDPETTKTTIIHSLGYPLVHSGDGRIYLYLFAWRSRMTDYHLFNPLSVPIIVIGMMHGVAMGPDQLPIHQSERKEFHTKQMLLIEFNRELEVVRYGIYEFPPAIIPSQIVEDWRTEPLAAYFVGVE